MNIAELVLAQRDLEAGATGFALLVSAYGLGLIGGSLYAGRDGGDVRRRYFAGLAALADRHARPPRSRRRSRSRCSPSPFTGAGQRPVRRQQPHDAAPRDPGARPRPRVRPRRLLRLLGLRARGDRRRRAGHRVRRPRDVRDRRPGRWRVVGLAPLHGARAAPARRRDVPRPQRRLPEPGQGFRSSARRDRVASTASSKVSAAPSATPDAKASGPSASRSAASALGPRPPRRAGGSRRSRRAARRRRPTAARRCAGRRGRPPRPPRSPGSSTIALRSPSSRASSRLSCRSASARAGSSSSSTRASDALGRRQVAGSATPRAIARLSSSSSIARSRCPAPSCAIPRFCSVRLSWRSSPSSRAITVASS